jgi:hypothetical protein
MAYQWNGTEHRWGERIRVNIPVHLSGIDGCMKNLSLSGALFKADVGLRLHSLVEVNIQLPAPSQYTQVVAALVSRKFNDNVAVEWCEFAPTVVKDLLRLPSIRLSV